MESVLVFREQLQELLFLILLDTSLRVGEQWCTVVLSVLFKEHDLIISKTHTLNVQEHIKVWWSVLSAKLVQAQILDFRSQRC